MGLSRKRIDRKGLQEAVVALKKEEKEFKEKYKEKKKEETKAMSTTGGVQDNRESEIETVDGFDELENGGEAKGKSTTEGGPILRIRVPLKRKANEAGTSESARSKVSKVNFLNALFADNALTVRSMSGTQKLDMRDGQMREEMHQVH